MSMIRCSCLSVLFSLGALSGLWAQPVKLGAGAYTLAPKGGDNAVPAAPFRTAEMLQQAAPTNQWYSALIFSAKPEALFAHPLTVLANSSGLELALPSKLVVPTERRDVEIHYPHTDPLLISPAAFVAGQPKLAKTGDWSIDIQWGQGASQMTATVAHGSPFASFELSQGDVRLRLPAPSVRAESADPRVLALNVKGKPYALFGPTGVRWESVSDTEWIGRLPVGKGYVSAAALPDASPQTLAMFTRHAYAFLTDTRVSWKFDEASSKVTNTYTATTRVMEGTDAGPLLGLYPHQWFNNPAVQAQLGHSYDTLRGKIRLLASSSFQTSQTYNGFVPFWPGVGENPRSTELRDLIKTDQRNARRMMLEIGTGPYWQGKGLQRITKLMDVVEQQGDLEGRDQLLKLLKGRVEQWFAGDNAKTYFHYDKALGTVAAYPEEYFSVEQMNDHHFHYGYWIRAMAEIALRDLGIYLYTTEIEAINHYWFDIHHLVFPPEYQNVETSMVFGGKYAHNTWWIDEPRQIKGINLLPITTASTYLGRDPAFVKRSVATLKPETDVFAARGKSAKPIDIWQDLFAKYLGVADAQAGLASWDRWGTFELGDTRTHALHWLLSLQEMGTPDFSVTANTVLYSVFRQADGRKTYLAFNAGKTPLEVTFSDGKTLSVAPGKLARAK